MTRVYLEQDGNRYTVTCNDHAETEAGCAAVSTLCCTLAGYLHNIDCRIHAEKIESGHVHISYSGDCTEAQAAFDMIYVGFLQFVQDYPNEVAVEFVEIE